LRAYEVQAEVKFWEERIDPGDGSSCFVGKGQDNKTVVSRDVPPVIRGMRLTLITLITLITLAVAKRCHAMILGARPATLVRIVHYLSSISSKKPAGMMGLLCGPSNRIWSDNAVPRQSTHLQ